jgi:hypothetical protein
MACAMCIGYTRYVYNLSDVDVLDEWERECRVCKQQKPIADFIHHTTRQKGRRVCVACRNKQAADYARQKRANPIERAKINARRSQRKREARENPALFAVYEKKRIAAYERDRVRGREYAKEARAKFEDGIERVYFIESVELCRIKIGYSSCHPQHRLSCMITGSADELRLLGWVPGSRLLEKRLHDRFAQQRVRGEWFTISDDLRAYIAENACK